MADIKNKFKSWLNNKGEGPDGRPVPEKADAAPREGADKDLSHPVPAAPVPETPVLSPQEKGEWELRQAALMEQEEAAHRNITRLAQDLSNARQKFQEELRSKEEERIKLLARHSLSDGNAQAALDRVQSEFERMQREAAAEITLLEKRLQDENAIWSKTLYELEKSAEEFRTGAEFRLQEKEIGNKRREQELARSLSELQALLNSLNAQAEAERRQWEESVKSVDEEAVHLRSQLQLKESNHRLQEQKLQQDLAQSRLEWESKVRALEVRLEQGRQKWQEEVARKESEVQTLKMEYEKKIAGLQHSFRSREEEILSAKMRAEGKLKNLEQEAAQFRSQSDADLKARREEMEKLKVELVLLDSQLKVDGEKAEAALVAVQKEAAGKIEFLQQKVQEDIRAGQKVIETKQSDLQALEVDFSIRRKSLEDEFNKKRTEIEEQSKFLQQKLGELGRVIEKEKEDHRKQLSQRDEQISSLKQAMTQRTEGVRKQRDQLSSELEFKKQKMSQDLAQLEEKARTEKQGLLDTLTELGRKISDKKAELAREQAALQHALKKQEDLLLFETQPLKNQIMDLENRLEQERATRAKILSAKEDILANLKKQKENQEAALPGELKLVEQKLERETAAFQDKLEQLQKGWNREKQALRDSQKKLEAEVRQTEEKIDSLPVLLEAEKGKLLEKHNVEMGRLKALEESVRNEVRAETREFELKSRRYEAQEAELNRHLNQLLASLDQARRDEEAKISEETRIWQEKIKAAEAAVETERQKETAALQEARGRLEALKDEHARKQFLFDSTREEAEKHWTLERGELEYKIASLQKEYDSQKLIWHRAFLERSTQIESFEAQIEEAKRAQALTVKNLEEKRRAVEAEFGKALAELEDRRQAVQREAEETLRSKNADLEDARQALDVFVRQSEAEQEKRVRDMAQARTELENRRDALQKSLDAAIDKSPKILAEKDQQIAYLKQHLATNEASFRAEWDKAEADFERGKKESAEKIAALQKQLAAESESFAARAAKLDRQIAVLKEQRQTSEENSRGILSALEADSAKVKSLLESEIADLEKKIVQERARFDQQLKVREMEIESLSRNLEQKEVQRNLARESRQKEIVQERDRLMQWQGSLEQTLNQEKQAAQKLVQEKQGQIDALKQQVQEQSERHRKETEERQQEILEVKGRMDAAVRELSQKLEAETQVHDSRLRDRQTELAQLSQKVSLWSETVKLEKEKDEQQWQEEQSRLNEEILKMEAALAEERTALDDVLRQRSEEISGMNRALNQLQLDHQNRLQDLQRQKADLLHEEEKWEGKLRDERAKIKEEMRVLEREIERLKVEMSLKETQYAIQKQKKEREARWARRPLESKLADLKHSWEEKEKEKRRKIAQQEADSQKILNEIKRVEEAAKKEVEEKQSALAALKQKIESQLQAARARFRDENASLLGGMAEKRKELSAVKQSLARLEELLQKSGQEPSGFGTHEIQTEITVWEKKLEDALLEEKKLAEREKLTLVQLQKELQEKRKDLAQEKIRTADILSKTKTEMDRLGEAARATEAAEERMRDIQLRSKSYIEIGFVAYSSDNFQEAMVSFQQALTLDPQSAVCHQMLGLIHEKQGNREAAREAYRKTLELEPENAFVKKHLEQI